LVYGIQLLDHKRRNEQQQIIPSEFNQLWQTT